MELALYILERKKANMIKNENDGDFQKFKKKMEILTKEKQEIYNGNEEVIQKVFTQYLKEVKINN